MSQGRTADARLERLLYVLPAANRPDGAPLSELAEALDTSEARILEDLEEVTARVYYQPGGWPDDVQIFLEGDRVRVRRATGFERPVRLSRKETLCLAMALRGSTASARIADEEERAALLERAETHLGRVDADATAGSVVSTPDRAPDPEGMRETLMSAARDRRACAIWYVKSGARDGSVRVVDPYSIVYAEGAWYAVAHCRKEEGIRVFRLDRVLAADVTEERFAVPDDFRVDAYVDSGRVYHAADHRKVRVRYSPRIARWIRERAEWDGSSMTEGEDAGEGVVVTHDVADPHWAVGHVLTYGDEAEILGPRDVRALVREVAEGMGA